MLSETKVTLCAAIIMGITCLFHPNCAGAQTASTSESDRSYQDWVVQGDTWLRRQEPPSRNPESAFRSFAPVINGEPNSTDKKPADHSAKPLAEK
jgi:hypothetical protein